MDGAGGLSLGVVVPGNEAGKLIGKGGSGLKSVREMSKCQVNLRQEPDANGNRKCDLQGPTVEHLASAIHAIACRLFQDGQPDCIMTLAIPNGYAGGVIGKGGDNLKRIREATGVKFHLERDNVGEQGERIGNLTGDRRQLGAAVRVAYSGIASANAGGMVGRGGAPAAPAQPYRTPYYSPTPAMPMHSQMPHAAPAAVITQVRKFSGDVNEVQLHMVIPSKFIGAVLGKEGSEIKRVLADSNCTNVSVTKRDSTPDRRVVIMGGFDECMYAQKLVYGLYTNAARVAQEEVSDVSVLFMVPQSTAGAVIGKEGNNLKRIREQAALKVKLERDEIEGYRPCLLSGSFDGIVSAERLIQEQVAAEVEDGPTNGAGKRRHEFMDSAMEPYHRQEAKRPRTLPSASPDVAQGLHGSLKLLVPARAAGAVIGKQGSTLKQIRESTGAHIEVVQQAQTMHHFPNDRVVIIKGSLSSRHAAMARVLQVAFERDEQAVALKMLVSGSQAGAIIGRQGANLKAIRERCEAGVKVERDDIAGERLVTANGHMDSILSAADMVLESTESGPPGGKGGGKDAHPVTVGAAY